jgi:uncharacterized protein YndB with AHSA1/START domain
MKAQGERTMIEVVSSVLIDRPLPEVFAYVTDFENDPNWIKEAVESKKTSSGPIGVGTTFSNVVQFMGRRFENRFQIIEYETERKLVAKILSGPIRFEMTENFEHVNGSTRLTVIDRVEPTGFFKLAQPLMGRQLKKSWDSSLGQLKNLLEAPV